MKRFFIILIATILVISSFFLILSIFQLYKDAEKVQKSILTREIVSAGSDVINRIDALLKGDTIVKVITPEPTDSLSNLLYTKQGKRFLLDPSMVTPIGVIRTRINYYKNDVVLTFNDTVFFDTTYLEFFSPDQYTLDNKALVTEVEKIGAIENVNLIEMDSSTQQLLNSDYLHRIIKALLENNITADFDFALYNYYTTQFVVKPQKVDPATILNSEFVFSLKPSERFAAPHYLIIYLKTNVSFYSKGWELSVPSFWL